MRRRSIARFFVMNPPARRCACPGQESGRRSDGAHRRDVGSSSSLPREGLDLLKGAVDAGGSI